MTTATLAVQDGGAVLERVITAGDLSQLSPIERVTYYKATCASVGLNPLTRPFEYINIRGKLILYARREATDQLRKLHSVSITRLEESKYGDLWVVTAYAQDGDGRTDSSKGIVNLEGLKGEDLANAMMKAETKAKRRVALSIVGLGLLDESEILTDAVPPIQVHAETERVASDLILPDKPEVKEPVQSATLTAEADERHALILKIQQAIKTKKITRPVVGKQKEVWLGSAEADPLKADVSALAALLEHLEALA